MATISDTNDCNPTITFEAGDIGKTFTLTQTVTDTFGLTSNTSKDIVVSAPESTLIPTVSSERGLSVIKSHAVCDCQSGYYFSSSDVGYTDGIHIVNERDYTSEEADDLNQTGSLSNIVLYTNRLILEFGNSLDCSLDITVEIANGADEGGFLDLDSVEFGFIEERLPGVDDQINIISGGESFYTGSLRVYHSEDNTLEFFIRSKSVLIKSIYIACS
ncbi:hypothetical protein N9043_00675 [bacterium]|nr:hypothetical protein [bacterium]